MPSPVSARRLVEWALRVLSMALMAVFLMRAWHVRDVALQPLLARQAEVAISLPRWSMVTPLRIHLSLDSVLTPEQRDWTAAIAHAGTRLTWSAPTLVATAVTTARIVDPAGALELSAAAPVRSTVIVRDHIGTIDSVIVGVGGLRLAIPGEAASVGVSVGPSTAWAAAPDSVVFRRLFVEGTASWETKFTIAALAERGWKVDAITHVAPGVDVRSGSPTALDTSRYAAIIAVDSTASLIARGAAAFVRSGGGLVTLRDARGIGPRASATVELERRGADDVRAFRVGSGRVIRVGYGDLWRERMVDQDTAADPVAEHRAWLAHVIAAVAYAPHVTAPYDSSADPAPLADMVDRLGPRTTQPDAASPFTREVPSSILFGILLVSLLLELTSRRLRGAK